MTITTEDQYSQVMKRIDQLMKKGEENLTHLELEELRALAIIAEKWEDLHF